ncbi:uncharacterized protein BO72DRAFT_310912 [Aspergillus fijiensis CBS 313.89]|uniref:Uncharacterized protein n=1 Tax=Aspergillus fijiensis CBS 313.89 TaxID=1448319 RepID=A0A8G1REY6_9EURO|nr:uncharacterized protein BO72DRAFT_310912 [Aspergillus fijiensis CBS 313.89]RAK71654.1 hypothetical protein BO72DRAFT_310912 [Aspergillus fijiensis CBS 313.89]
MRLGMCPNLGLRQSWLSSVYLLGDRVIALAWGIVCQVHHYTAVLMLRRCDSNRGLYMKCNFLLLVWTKSASLVLEHRKTSGPIAPSSSLAVRWSILFFAPRWCFLLRCPRAQSIVL